MPIFLRAETQKSERPEAYTYLLDELLHYPDGKPQSRKRYYIDSSTNHQEKILHGVFETYYQDGSIDTHTLYEHGTEKKHQHWSHDGRLRYQQEFSPEGFKSSHYIYDQKGNHPLMAFVDSVDYGTWGGNHLLPKLPARFLYEEVFYFPDGKYVQERSKYYYQHPDTEPTKVRHGSHETYDEKGFLKKVIWYFHGEVLSVSHFSASFYVFSCEKQSHSGRLGVQVRPTLATDSTDLDGYFALSQKVKRKLKAGVRKRMKTMENPYSGSMAVELEGLATESYGLVYADGRKDFTSQPKLNRLFRGKWYGLKLEEVRKRRKSDLDRVLKKLQKLPATVRSSILHSKSLFLQFSKEVNGSEMRLLPEVTAHLVEVHFFDENGELIKRLPLP